MRIISILRGCTVVAASVVLAGAAFGQPLRAVTIATSSSSIPGATARLAKELGLFEKQGLQAQITPMDTGSVATAALLGGSIDFVTSGPSDVVNAHAQGHKLVVLTSTYRGFAATLVLSKAAAAKVGVAPNATVEARLKALDGLTIATTSSSSTYGVGPRSATEAAGAKVKFTFMGQPAMIAAFRRGIIDGYVASAPFYLPPVIDGTGLVWIQGSKGEWPSESAPVNSTVLFAKRGFAEAEPDLVKRVVAVFADFSKAVDERPGEVRAAMAKLWPNLDAKTVDLVLASESPGFKGKPVSVADMAHEIAFMKLGVPNLKMDRLNPAAMLFP